MCRTRGMSYQKCGVNIGPVHAKHRLRQRAAAESAVSGLTGVRNVKDEIGLVYDVDPADVSWLVRKALGHVTPPDDSHVVVRASGNTGTLIGHVRT
jgi:osmotically-inducible protein OsmY